MLCIQSYFVLNVAHLPLLNHCPQILAAFPESENGENVFHLVIGTKLGFLERLHNLHVSTYREEKKQSTVAAVLTIFAASGMIKRSRDLRRRSWGLYWSFKSRIFYTGRISVCDGFIPASSPAPSQPACSLPHQWDQGENWKGESWKTHGLRQRQCNGESKSHAHKQNKTRN